jgi:rhomboid family GlyGly-CTERM serine protease
MKDLSVSIKRSLAALRDIVAGRPELLVFTGLLAIANAPIFFGSSFQSLAFRPDEVYRGEWWRLFTHTFVHVTWYHLVLDGAAFLTLYSTLAESRLGRRLAYVFAAGTGSLLLSWVAAPNPANGLCGLSGIAHGLMAVSALELIMAGASGSPERRVGWISLGLVMVKAAFEALTGRMFLAFLDFGMLGTPVAVSHAGGIVGALVAVLALNYCAPISRIKNPSPSCVSCKGAPAD